MPIDLQLSPRNPNTRNHSESAFQEGGVWDQNQGANQTRLFAECFHKHSRIPFTAEFSVLDIGCALGDALPVWKMHYPQARLFGCDVAESAISRAKDRYGAIAKFFLAGFEDLQGRWDVIYCSNVMEHFEQHVAIATALLAHCNVLYVMTPYLELRDGRSIVPEPGDFHVATFDKKPFNSLEANHGAAISTKVVSCPGAWGNGIRSEFVSRVRSLWKGDVYAPRRQVIYSIFSESK